MNILGIETSCDETAVAIVNDKGQILSNLVLSQLKEHRAFGGVVPEIAARAHLDHLDSLIAAALEDAKCRFEDIEAVAATCGPGLIGGVLVGMMTAKAIAAARKIPFFGINHLEGHALTPRLTDNLSFPYLLLLVSGGHTQILLIKGAGDYERWGTTLDDAAGECFDKSAKIMGLPYPGGPELEKAAALCLDPAAAVSRFVLPRPMIHRKELDFSFSGLKTAVINHVHRLGPDTLKPEDIYALAFSFQNAVAEIMAERCQKALTRFFEEEKSLPCLVVSGGVAANGAIRDSLKSLCEKNKVPFYAPPLNLCGDNAAMIAWAAHERLKAGLTTGDGLDFPARPRWPLDPLAPSRHGAGVKA